MVFCSKYTKNKKQKVVEKLNTHLGLITVTHHFYLQNEGRYRQKSYTPIKACFIPIFIPIDWIYLIIKNINAC